MVIDMIIYSDKENKKWTIIELILKVIMNALVLVMTTKVFNGFYISSFKYAILTAIVIMILNATVKPILKVLTLPVTIYTLGLFYPFVNVIILKLASLIMGSNFIVHGWLVPFFISIFISIMNLILDVTITKQIVGDKK